MDLVSALVPTFAAVQILDVLWAPRRRKSVNKRTKVYHHVSSSVMSVVRTILGTVSPMVIAVIQSHVPQMTDAD
uniref:Uncharacterized protein n=1 Tax=Arion vulgaris TaxID=1028688 RepID=A0A0B6YU69_9EUPU